MTARARMARPQAALALCARRWCDRLRRPTSDSMGAITFSGSSWWPCCTASGASESRAEARATGAGGVPRLLRRFVGLDGPWGRVLGPVITPDRIRFLEGPGGVQRRGGVEGVCTEIRGCRPVLTVGQGV